MAQVATFDTIITTENITMNQNTEKSPGPRPVHMVSLGEISRQVRKNMSRFHMGDVISPSEMKSARRELAPNQNTAFHPGNRAGVFIWRIFIPPTYDL